MNRRRKPSQTASYNMNFLVFMMWEVSIYKQNGNCLNIFKMNSIRYKIDNSAYKFMNLMCGI